MFLKRNFSENAPTVLNNDAAIHDLLAEAKAKEEASNNLRCNVLVNDGHVHVSHQDEEEKVTEATPDCHILSVHMRLPKVTLVKHMF